MSFGEQRRERRKEVMKYVIIKGVAGNDDVWKGGEKERSDGIRNKKE